MSAFCEECIWKKICINILHEYVNGRSYLGLKFVKNVHGITKGAEGKT